jgi:hypothetical protein
MIKFAPEMCAYFNSEIQRLFEQMGFPAMRSDGGMTTHVWCMLDFATAVVLERGYAR